MHVLLGFLGAAVTILVLLYRLAGIGIDLGGLNPFSWRRQRAWRQKFDANPLFTLQDPRAIAAVLVVGAAKIDGDLSLEEKSAVLAELENTLSMSPKAASELLGSTVFMLGDLQVFGSQLDALLDRYREQLDDDQVASLLDMLDRIAATGGGPTARQRELRAAVQSKWRPENGQAGTWG